MTPFKDTLEDCTVAEDAMREAGLDWLADAIGGMKRGHEMRIEAEAEAKRGRTAKLKAYRTKRFRSLSWHWMSAA